MGALARKPPERLNMFTTLKKLLTVAIAAGTLATGSLAVATPAAAKGFHFKHGHGHHGHHHGHWHFKKFYGYYGGYNPCYWVHKPWGLVKVCPSYYY
jgi:hypothetical protein